MNKRLIAILSILSLVVFLPLVPAHSATKAGAKCTKAGIKSVVGNKTFTCIKSGKKLVWNKGTITSIPVPSPTRSNQVDFEISPRSVFSDKSKCQLRQNYQNFFLTGFGFPRSQDRLKNQGEVKGILVFVEFNDVKGTDDPSIEGKKFSETFVDYYQQVSYQKLQFKVDIYPKYISIPVDSGSYGMDTYNKGNPWAYFKDGLRFSDPVINFAPYEFVVFIPPSGISKIVYGPSFPLPPNDPNGFTAEKYILNGAVGGSDWRNHPTLKWVWLGHEIGHDLGMEHQYSDTNNGIWDLMHNMWSASPALFGWHRFLQGWFSDSQILCSDLSLFSTNRVLVDISTLGMIDENVKTLMIKLNESEIIVIETRKKAPFDLINLGSNYEGILVYKVNVNKRSNEGAITLITTQTPSKIDGVIVGTLTKGEYVESDGLRITNLGVSKNGYYVEIKKSIP